MSSYGLDNVTTADTYPKDGEGASVIGDGIVRLVIFITGAAVYRQLARGRGNWGPERFMPPFGYTLERVCDGIRFRSAVAGTPAQVTVEAATVHDLPDDDA